MSQLETEEKKDDVQPVFAPQALEQAPAEAATSNEQEAVLTNLMMLEPGDHKLLAQAIANYPELREQILERASQLLGNDTVAKALQVLAGVPEPEAPSEQVSDAPADGPAAAGPAQDATFDYTTSPLALEYDEAAKIKDHADFMRANPQVADQVLTQTAELDPTLALLVITEYEYGNAKAGEAPQQEETPPQVIEESSKEAAQEIRAEEPKTEDAAAVPAQQAVEEAAPVVEPEKESGWVVRARAFNAEHADDAAAFMAATGGACMVDGHLDPNLIAQWQSRHSVEVDGRIGQQTVDAAIKQQPETAEEAKKEAQEEALPEPDPTDPRYAL